MTLAAWRGPHSAEVCRGRGPAAGRPSTARAPPPESSGAPRNQLRGTAIYRGLSLEAKQAGGMGIARGRLQEERKSWRKDHPHVRARPHAAWLPPIAPLRHPALRRRLKQRAASLSLCAGSVACAGLRCQAGQRG